MSETATALAPREEHTPAVTPMQMLSMAVEQNADLDKLTKLMDLQERWEANQARKSFVHALNAFKAEPPTVLKNKSANYGGRGAAYGYATLAQVAGVIAPALSQHGLSHRWATMQDDGGISVICVLTHEGGHSESVTMTAPADNSGSKNGIQAIGSTVTYLERYTLLAITGLAAVDQDDDGSRAVDETVLTEEHKSEIIKAMYRKKDPEAVSTRLLKALAVPTLDLMPDSRFQEAMNLLAKVKDVEKTDG